MRNGVGLEKKVLNEILESLGKEFFEYIEEYEKKFNVVYKYFLRGLSLIRIVKYFLDGYY